MRQGTFLDFTGIFLLCLWVLTVFNRGGAAVGIGAFGIPHLLVLLAPVLYGLGHSNSLPRRDILLLVPIAVIALIGAMHLANEGFSSEQLLNASPMFYPVVVLAGVYVARKWLNRLHKFYWSLFIAVSLLAISAPAVRALLSGVIVINGHSLFGFYGSYYTVVIPAFCYFFTRAIRGRTILLTIISTAAILVLGSRSGMVALFISIMCLFLAADKARFAFKSLLLISALLAALTFIFPLLNYFSAGFRGDFSPSYYFYALLSIVVPEAGMADFGTAFVGSRTHRMEMAYEIIQEVMKSSSTTLFGLGVSEPLVETSFRNPHNGYVTILGRSGMIGLAALVWLVIYTAIMVRSWGKRSESMLEDRDRAFCWAVLLSGIWMIGFTTLLDSPMNAIPFFFLLGAIFGQATGTKHSRHAMQKPNP